LFVRHEIVNLPSASVLGILRAQAAGRKPAPRAIAVLADPVFDQGDTRVTAHRVSAQPVASVQPNPDQDQAVERSAAMLNRAGTEMGLTRDGKLHLPRLPYSRREADAIFAMAPAGAGKEALDFQASKATAMSPELAQYRIVHFATHGLVNGEHPELSGLVFSLVDQEGKRQDGFLHLQDIYNMDLPVELVVLSACETALGKEIRGEGMIGLTRGFMYAGATRVVASLWEVSDVASSQFMTEFYSSMEKDGAAPAAALRAAQLSMWKQKRWNKPYYWGAFQIHGEWK
jgi:CHAT domain-containing protein